MALRHIGRLIAFTDQVQKRQLDAAVFQLSRHPERYQYREFPDRDSAYLFVTLEAARLRGDL